MNFANPHYFSAILDGIKHRFILILECESVQGADLNGPPRFSVGALNGTRDPRVAASRQLLEVGVASTALQIPPTWLMAHQYIYVVHDNTDEHGWQYRSMWPIQGPGSGGGGGREEPWSASLMASSMVRRRVWMTTIVPRESLTVAKRLLCENIRADRDGASGSSVRMQGELMRYEKGTITKSWQRRRVLLKHNRLEFYAGPTKKGEIALTDCEVKMLFESQCPGKPFAFSIRNPVGTVGILLDAESKDMRRSWVVALQYQLAINSDELNFPPLEYGPPTGDAVYPDTRVLLCGDLMLQSRDLAGNLIWSPRHFQLRPREIVYFEGEKMMGRLFVEGAEIFGDDRSLNFTIVSASGIQLYLSADSPETKELWLMGVQRAVHAVDLQYARLKFAPQEEQRDPQVPVSERIAQYYDERWTAPAVDGEDEEYLQRVFDAPVTNNPNSVEFTEQLLPAYGAAPNSSYREDFAAEKQQRTEHHEDESFHTTTPDGGASSMARHASSSNEKHAAVSGSVERSNVTDAQGNSRSVSSSSHHVVQQQSSSHTETTYSSSTAFGAGTEARAGHRATHFLGSDQNDQNAHGKPWLDQSWHQKQGGQDGGMIVEEPEEESEEEEHGRGAGMESKLQQDEAGERGQKRLEQVAATLTSTQASFAILPEHLGATPTSSQVNLQLLAATTSALSPHRALINPKFVLKALRGITHRFLLVLESEYLSEEAAQALDSQAEQAGQADAKAAMKAAKARNSAPARFTVGGPRASKDPRTATLAELLPVSNSKPEIQLPPGWVMLHQYIYIVQQNTDDNGWQYRAAWSDGALGSRDEQWAPAFDAQLGHCARRRLWMTTVVKKDEVIRCKKILQDALGRDKDGPQRRDAILQGNLLRHQQGNQDSSASGGGAGGGWQRRKAVLFHDKLELLLGGERKGEAVLEGCEVRLLAPHQTPDGQQEWAFSIRNSTGSVALVLAAESAECRLQWVRALQYQIAVTTPDVNFPPFMCGPPTGELGEHTRILLCGDLMRDGAIRLQVQLRPYELLCLRREQVVCRLQLEGAVCRSSLASSSASLAGAGSDSSTQGTDDSNANFSVHSASGCELRLRADSAEVKQQWVRAIKRQVGLQTSLRQHQREARADRDAAALLRQELRDSLWEAGGSSVEAEAEESAFLEAHQAEQDALQSSEVWDGEERPFQRPRGTPRPPSTSYHAPSSDTGSGSISNNRRSGSHGRGPGGSGSSSSARKAAREGVVPSSGLGASRGEGVGADDEDAVRREKGEGGGDGDDSEGSDDVQIVSGGPSSAVELRQLRQRQSPTRSLEEPPWRQESDGPDHSRRQDQGQGHGAVESKGEVEVAVELALRGTSPRAELASKTESKSTKTSTTSTTSSSSSTTVLASSNRASSLAPHPLVRSPSSGSGVNMGIAGAGTGTGVGAAALRTSPRGGPQPAQASSFYLSASSSASPNRASPRSGGTPGSPSPQHSPRTLHRAPSLTDKSNLRNAFSQLTQSASPAPLSPTSPTSPSMQQQAFTSATKTTTTSSSSKKVTSNSNTTTTTTSFSSAAFHSPGPGGSLLTPSSAPPSGQQQRLPRGPTSIKDVKLRSVDSSEGRAGTPDGRRHGAGALPRAVLTPEADEQSVMSGVSLDEVRQRNRRIGKDLPLDGKVGSQVLHMETQMLQRMQSESGSAKLNRQRSQQQQQQHPGAGAPAGDGEAGGGGAYISASASVDSGKFSAGSGSGSGKH